MESRQDRCDRLSRRAAALDFASDEVCDYFAIGFAEKGAAVSDQFVAQGLEILDDPVVDERNRSGDVRMRIIDRRSAMAC